MALGTVGKGSIKLERRGWDPQGSNSGFLNYFT